MFLFWLLLALALGVGEQIKLEYDAYKYNKQIIKPEFNVTKLMSLDQISLSSETMCLDFSNMTPYSIAAILHETNYSSNLKVSTVAISKIIWDDICMQLEEWSDNPEEVLTNDEFERVSGRKIIECKSTNLNTLILKLKMLNYKKVLLLLT